MLIPLEWICGVEFAVWFFLFLIYFLLFPALAGYSLRQQFDAALFNEKFWHRSEESLPFYKYRRAGVYALAVASKIIARRRFPGNDMLKGTNVWLRIGCTAFLVSFLFVCFIAICGSFINLGACKA